MQTEIASTWVDLQRKKLIKVNLMTNEGEILDLNQIMDSIFSHIFGEEESTDVIFNELMPLISRTSLISIPFLFDEKTTGYITDTPSLRNAFLEMCTVHFLLAKFIADNNLQLEVTETDIDDDQVDLYRQEMKDKK